MDKKINISWDILVKKVRWGLTPEEESAFREWLAQDKSHEVYFERVRKVWDADRADFFFKVKSVQGDDSFRCLRGERERTPRVVG